MKILIAPDKFKDALDAAAVAAALAAGVREVRLDIEVVACPLADGGEGTGSLLAAALDAEERIEPVHDPLGRARAARWWLCRDGKTAIVEMAEASGLALLEPHERNALRTTTYGTGQLLHAARDTGCTHVVLCVGGSATVDGGAGCLQALGWELCDATGTPLRELARGGTLSQIAKLRPPREPFDLTIEVLWDVDSPLIGPRGAAPVFGPQKGATPEAVRDLERGLTNWADVLRRECRREVATLPGAGAAGGLPAALVAAYDARLVSGFGEVAKRLELRTKLAGCQLCFTGEGRLDDQTTSGKVVAGVAGVAAAAAVPVMAFVGAVRLRARQTIDDLAKEIGLKEIVVISPPDTPTAEALPATAVNLRTAARATVTAHTKGA